MEQISEIRKEMRDFLDKLPGPKEPPKGSFYDLGSGLDEIPRRKLGGALVPFACGVARFCQRTLD